MRAALYARVSTEDQEREGTSLESQTEALLKKARELGGEVSKECVLQEVFSGLTLDRPKLTELREWVKRKEIDAVIVYSTDRLSRDPVHLLLLVDEFEKAGVRIHFITEPLDNSLEGQLLGFVRGWASKVEALKIRERTMRGKLSRAKEGKHPGGRAAYGYKLVDAKHVIEPKEADIIRMVFDWLAKDGVSLRGVQHRLIKMGIATRKGKSWWQRATLYRIVTDPMYVGQWYYNKHVDAPAKTKDSGTVQVLKPREQWIPVEVPAIVSQETFEAAQRQLARNRELCCRNTKREYLLSGLLICGNCGFKFGARTTGGRAYYCCSSKSGNNRPKLCSSKNVRGDRLETVVWESISRLLSRPELIIEQMKNREQANPAAYLKASLDRVSQALERKRVEADRMLDAYKIGAIDLQTLKRKMDEVKSEEAELDQEKSRLKREIRRSEARELNEEKLHQFCQSLPATLANLSFENKRQILREVVDKIVVDGNDITIYGIIPVPEERSEDVAVALPSS